MAVDASLGIESIHVPYQGSSPAIQDFRAEVLDTFYDMVVQNSDMIEDKEAVAIAIALPERNPSLLDVPTSKEQGFDVVIENWIGLSALAGMPEELVGSIHETVMAVFANSDVQVRLTELGITHNAISSEEYDTFVADQIAIWEPLIISSGISE